MLLVHLPGYDRSAPVEPYGMGHSHALVEDTLAARGIGAAHFIGFSSGAYRAIALAARGQIRARSIVSLAGTADFTDEDKKGLAQTVTMLRAGVDPEAALLDSALSPRGRENHAAVADVRSWARATTPERLARELEAFIAAADLRPQLATLGIPILVRVGSIDAASPPERSRRMVDALRCSTSSELRGVRFEEVPGVGHALLREDFESTAESIERHLAGVASS